MADVTMAEMSWGDRFEKALDTITNDDGMAELEVLSPLIRLCVEARAQWCAWEANSKTKDDRIEDLINDNTWLRSRLAERINELDER